MLYWVIFVRCITNKHVDTINMLTHGRRPGVCVVCGGVAARRKMIRHGMWPPGSVWQALQLQVRAQ